jgi:phosphoglucosamine mutase
MERHLFGTDGIRGVAGEYPLDPATTFAVGRALGEWLKAGGHSEEVVLGVDTRESGGWIAEHVAGGLAQAGVPSRFAGLITTPGVAWVTRHGPFSLGVMISASHNPYQDNGIKVIDHSGFKLADAAEHAIEQEIFRALDRGVEPRPLELTADLGLDQEYLASLAATLPAGLRGWRVVIDGANGAASALAPELFRRLGAEVDAIHCAPDGKNINRDCGSLHLAGLRRRVAETGADVGVAFDGDADRALFVAASGRVLDGDAAMLITAREWQRQGRLRGGVVVATVMSNLGLEVALQRHDIGLVRTQVGDRYVFEEMVKRDAAIGGEQSGHLIFRDYATMGDGMLTALRVLGVAREDGRPLAELAAELEVFPQLLRNVRIRERRPLERMPRVLEEIRAAESAFGDEGRVLVRFSGTEPLARVMVEARDPAAVEHWTGRIADTIREEIGA